MDFAWDLEQEKYTNIIDTNITGMIHGSLTAVLNMKKQGYGKIYNMEGFGSNGMMQPKIAIYGTTKRALRYFTRSLSKEVKNANILIGTISPGMVITDFITSPLKNQSSEEQNNTIKIFNILADKVETVTPFLVKKMLQNTKNGVSIEWLTKSKIIWRFLTSSIFKRNVFTSNEFKNV
jgi:short-subunit dehydrogenase